MQRVNSHDQNLEIEMPSFVWPEEKGHYKVSIPSCVRVCVCVCVCVWGGEGRRGGARGAPLHQRQKLPAEVQGCCRLSRTL